MWSTSELIELIIELDRKRRAKAASFDPVPEPAPKPEPTCNPYPSGSNEWFRWLSQHPSPREKGLDMNDLRRAADRERKARRLPRSAEECQRPARSTGFWWY